MLVVFLPLHRFSHLFGDFFVDVLTGCFISFSKVNLQLLWERIAAVISFCFFFLLLVDPLLFV